MIIVFVFIDEQFADIPVTACFYDKVRLTQPCDPIFIWLIFFLINYCPILKIGFIYLTFGIGDCHIQKFGTFTFIQIIVKDTRI